MDIAYRPLTPPSAHPDSLQAHGYRLELLRIALKFKNKQDFAAEIGVSPQVYSQYATGATAMPFERIATLRRKFGVDSGYLYHGFTEHLAHGLVLEIERAALRYPMGTPRRGPGRPIE